MILERVVSIALGIWALSYIPAATATLLNVCTTNAWVLNIIIIEPSNSTYMLGIYFCCY